MKLLLTSQCLHNDAIAAALRKLLSKPSDKCTAVYISTSQNGAVGDKSWFIKNLTDAHAVGWKSFEIIDLAAAIDLPRDMWWGSIETADVLFVGGGANFYLGYWLERSGLAQQLPKFLETKLYVGVSAGSMICTSSLITASESMEQVANNEPLAMELHGPEGQRSPQTLKLVDFIIRPHYQYADYPFITDDTLQQAANISSRITYALDDDSAIVIDGETIEVVSEGNWKKFIPRVVNTLHQV